MEYRFDFDEQLPDLPMAFDLQAVAQLFEQQLLRQPSILARRGTSRYSAFKTQSTSQPGAA